ncbi:MAG: hypothetical protein Q8R26_02205 [bacterium]|nr:hypothetical protein [bacterium]
MALGTEVKIEEVSSVDLSIRKIAALAGVGTLLAFLCGLFFQIFLNGGALGFLILAVTAGSLFLSVFLLQAFFIKGSSLSGGAVIVEAIALIIPLVGHWSGLFIAASLALGALLWTATFQGRRFVGNQVKIHFFQVQRVILPRALTALSLFVSLVYVGTLGLVGNELPRAGVDAFLKPMEPIGRQFFTPDFSLDLSIRDIATSMATMQLEQQFGIKAVDIPREVFNEAIDGIIKQVHDVAAQYKVRISESDSIGDFIYNYLQAQIQRIPLMWQQFQLIPLAVLLLVFLTVKSFAYLLQLLIAPITYLIYEISFLVGFSYLTLESHNREIILLKE